MTVKSLLKSVFGAAFLIVAVAGGLSAQESVSEVGASDNLSVLIFGATGPTGFNVAKILHERGDQVTAFVRASSDTTELDALGITTVVGDALDVASVEAATNSGSFDQVLTTLGCYSCDPPVDSTGNINVAEAAKAAGVSRVLLVTSIGAGDSADAPPFLSKWFLRNVLPLKTEAEDHLKASGLDYTIIRPGGLVSKGATGNGYLSEDPMTFGLIDRADLAELIVECMDDDGTIGKTYSAADTELRYPWDMFM